MKIMLPQSPIEICDAVKAKASLLRHCKIDGPCLIWTGARRGKHGVVRVGNTTRNVQRVAYAVFIGPVGDGETVGQTCNHTLCIDPRHLAKGTQSKALIAEQEPNICLA